jgi:hypothetical protein
LIFLSFTKAEDRRVKQSLLGIGINGRGEEVEKGCGRVNMVQILCTCECKWKNDTC